MNGSSKRKYTRSVYYLLSSSRFPVSVSFQTVKRRSSSFKRCVWMDGKKIPSTINFKIVERGDWLKIEIFFFILGEKLSKKKFRFTLRKKIGAIRDGDLLLAKARRTVPVHIGRRKEEKQLGSVSSLCVPCNNSLLNPRCPSVRPYGTTTRRFKTKHTLHDTDYNDTTRIHRGTRTHTYMVHTRALSLPIQTLHIYTRARNSCIENSRSIVASSTR